MLEEAAFETNQYHIQSHGEALKPKFPGQELEKFTRCCFRMGLVQMLNQRSYWEEDLRYTGVSSILSKKRFKSIIRSIHFVNNLTVDEDTKISDKLWKTRPWLNDLWKNCLSVSPEEHNSVDEVMVPFKGRNLLRQYMPNKPHKRGFKIWVRSGISSILYDFDVYQGR